MSKSEQYWQNKAREGNLGLWELKDKISNLEQQLTAERAKVALAIVGLEAIERNEHGMTWAGATATRTLKEVVAIQSSDALAEIRRKVARECAEDIKAIADSMPASSTKEKIWLEVARYIRAKFGVTE